MNTKEIEALYKEYVLPTYNRLPVCLVKGKGSKVWDIEGKEYLDFFPGWAVSGLGHCHPTVVHAIKHQVVKMLHVPNHFYVVKQALLAQKLIERSFPGRVFFCNSGAEAIESAIKFARKFGSSEERFEIVTMEHSFHGRTLAALTATGQERIHEGFRPLVPGFKYVPFNDFPALENAVNDKTVAVLLEPIQGEGGINVADQAYVKKIRKLCDKRNMLLIFDEVQTGMGRTGEWFCFKHFDVEPDLMTLAKSLGSGVPIGALVVHRRIKKEVLGPGTHASTYGGNPLVTSAALGVIKAIEKEGLLQNAKEMGDYLRHRLNGLAKKFPIIKEVRGIGLMLGVVLTQTGADIVNECRAQGLLINCTQGNVLRWMPAMTITKRTIDQGIQIFEGVLKKLELSESLSK
jgi:acetylornithine/N-succinyldiaminopimelate aminotransferase